MWAHTGAFISFTNASRTDGDEEPLLSARLREVCRSLRSPAADARLPSYTVCGRVHARTDVDRLNAARETCKYGPENTPFDRCRVFCTETRRHTRGHLTGSRAVRLGGDTARLYVRRCRVGFFSFRSSLPSNFEKGERKRNKKETQLSFPVVAGSAPLAVSCSNGVQRSGSLSAAP